MLSTKAAHAKDMNQPRGREVFQHRHYAEIARIIRALRRGDSTSDFDADRVARHFAHELNGTNANFNAARFLAACEA